ncbi:MAG: hypothetical protein WCL47_09205 [Holophagaceae bacterium]
MAITMFAVGSPTPCTADAQPRDQGRAGSREQVTAAPDVPLDKLTLSRDAQRLARTQGKEGFHQHFQALGRLIQAGDLEGARQAYSTISALLQGRPATSSEEAFLARDFGSLGQALASGDLAAAESAWSAQGADLAARKPQPYPSPSPVFAMGAYLQQAAQARS